MRVTSKVILAVVFAMITAITYSLNILALAPHFPLQWIALVSFVIFAIIVLWSWISAELQLKQLKETRPSIIVEPYGFNLMVRNLGASAEFTVNMEIIQPVIEPTPLAGYWEKSKSYKTQIMKGDFDTILIGKSINKELYVQYYNFNVQDVFYTSWWLPDKTKEQPLIPKCNLEIRINSKPEFAKPEYHNYVLDLEELHWVKDFKF